MITNKIKTIGFYTIIGLSYAASASAGIVKCGGTGQSECQLSDLILTVVRIINFLLSWAWLIAIFYVMWAGYDMIFAGGNTEALSNAKTKFSHAIIGFVLILCAYLILNWIVSLFTGDGTPRPGSFDIIRALILK